MDDLASVRNPRRRVGVGAAVVLVLVALGCAVLVASLGDHGSSAEVVRVSETAGEPPAAGSTPSSATGLANGAIFVHILGAVAHPGIYELDGGARAIDAVAAAGGFLGTADERGLNLARFVVDGEQIIVPLIGEVPVTAPGTAVDGTININTADAATLQTLPRVGPAMAARIIAWRETNGPFTAIEDLMDVAGIGDRTFEGMRELVSV